MKVNEVRAHRRVCFVEKVPCIFGCSQELKGKAEHLRHATLECPRVDTVCQNCGGCAKREDQDAHDCWPNLISRVQSDKPDSLRVAFDATVTRVFGQIKSKDDEN